jgi:hypothetical protein
LMNRSSVTLTSRCHAPKLIARANRWRNSY